MRHGRGVEEETEDEDRLHLGPGVEVRGDDRAAPEGRNERRQVQLLPRISRLPPGNPRQPPHRHGEHRDPLRRHARHKGPSKSVVFFFPHDLAFLGSRLVVWHTLRE